MHSDALEHSLSLVVARVGHPSEQIYARLFAQSPELETLFVLDRNGSVRNEMVRLCFDALLDLCGDGHYARGLLSTELVNHRNIGVTPQQFQALFTTVRDVVQAINGADWTPASAAAWDHVLGRVDQLVQALAPDGAAGSGARNATPQATTTETRP